MPNREVYKTMLQKDGISNRDRIITQAQRDIAENVISLPSYKKVLINETIEQFLQINSTDKDSKKRFTTIPNETVKLGDIISWNKMHWLVTQVDFDDEIVMRGEIEQCNKEIKWQNPITKEIITRWCFVERPYSSGIDESNVINTLNGKYKIQLPYDEETKLLNIDKRIMFDVVDNIGEIYKIVFSDKNTNKYQDIIGGFIELILSSDVQNENDNIELMICDYLKPDKPTPPVPPTELLKCEIDGRKEIKLGYARKYDATFYDVNNQIVTDIIPKWEILISDEYKKYISVNEYDNYIELKTEFNDNILGEEIVIKLCDNNGLYDICEFKIMVVNAFG